MSLAKLGKRTPKQKVIGDETVYCRSLTLREYLVAEPLMQTDGARVPLMRHMIACAVTDAAGAPLFSGADDPAIDDVPLDVMYELVSEITHLTNTGSFKGIEKNSVATP